MNLFLIENDRSLSGLFAGADYVAGRDAILCFNYLPYLKLRSQGGTHRFCFIEDLLSKADYSDLHSAVDRFAKRWYMDAGRDRTEFNGISFGEVSEIALSRSYMLSVLVKYGEVMRLAKARWASVEWVFHDFSGEANPFFYYEDDQKKIFDKGKLVEIVGRQLGLKVSNIACSDPIPSVLIARRDPADAREAPKTFSARARSLAAAAVRNGLLLLSKLRNIGVRRSNGIYFFFYHNARSVTSSHADRLILPSGSLISLRWSAIPLILKGARFLDIERITFLEGPSQARFMDETGEWFCSEEYQRKAGGLFEFNGVTYAEIYLPAIRDIVRTLIPQLVRYGAQARKAIRQHSIGSVILDEDLTEYQRLLIRVCELEHVQSVFLDHGIQGHRHAQKVCDRGGCDIVLCPGSFYVDYYRSQERRAREYFVVGSPALDPLAGAPKRSNGRLSRVLFLTFEDNFYARLDRFPWQEKYAAEIMPVINRLVDAGVEVLYKPHFENRAYHRHLFEFFGVDERRINYLERGEFVSFVKTVDLVICNVTSCFYEGLAARVPTIFFEPAYNEGALLPPLSSSDPGEVLRFSTGEELWKFIERHKDDMSALHRFVDSFLEEKAGAYMGQLDGKSGSRVLEALTRDRLPARAESVRPQ